MPSSPDSDAELKAALVSVHAVLVESGVEHALCGGIAANLYRTEMRTTTDVDLYVLCSAPQAVTLARAFEERGWTAHPAWRKAELLRLERVDLPRVDLLIAATEFERQAVRRAIPTIIAGRRIHVLKPEDLIVFKLVAGRFRDYEAVAAIVNTNPTSLDRGFIRRALAEIGMEDRWERALEGAEREAEDRG
jgi:predicted nucleotidyltransferase